jgi:hypothetical protein
MYLDIKIPVLPTCVAIDGTTTVVVAAKRKVRRRVLEKTESRESAPGFVMQKQEILPVKHSYSEAISP